jgi:hypothetical protein
MSDYYGPSAAALRSRYDFTALNREQLVADRKNAAIAFGTFGALVGLFAGAAGGALRRSISAGASAALAGLLLGGIGGATAGYELAPVFGWYYSDVEPSLLLPLLIRGGIWAVVGMTAGLALGCGWHGARGILLTLTGGLAGSVIGTLAFEVVVALIFPADRNDKILPSSPVTRLLAYLFVAAFVALGAVTLGRGGSRRASSTSPT